MGWKQPIDTDVLSWFGDDHLARDLFIHLLLRARNEDMEKPAMYQGKLYQLKRGQVIFGRNEFSKRLRASPSGTSKALLRIAKVWCKVTCEVSKNYTVITILNYDDLVLGNKQKNKQVTSKPRKSDTNQNVDKSGKSEKNVLIANGSVNPPQHQLQTIVEKEYPNISKLPSQLTHQESERLYRDYDQDTIIDYLNRMENYKPLRNKCVSVNLTIRNWMNRDNVKKRSAKERVI